MVSPAIANHMQGPELGLDHTMVSHANPDHMQGNVLKLGYDSYLYMIPSNSWQTSEHHRIH